MHRVFSSGRHSVGVWGALSIHGLGPLLRVEGRFNASAYGDILEDVLIPYALEGPFPDGCFVFQHDRSPVHMAKAVQRLMDRVAITQLEWPARSPDLNVIENIWGLMKRRMSARRSPFRNGDALWTAIEAEWNDLRQDPHLVESLYSSLPKRMEAVIAANGEAIRY